MRDSWSYFEKGELTLQDIKDLNKSGKLPDCVKINGFLYEFSLDMHRGDVVSITTGDVVSYVSS